MKFTCDEIFIESPILVPVEPLSGYILSLELVNSCDKEIWGACRITRVDTETGHIERMIADQAKGLSGGLELRCDDRDEAKRIFQDEMFHIIMRFVAGIRQAKRKAYRSISPPMGSTHEC